MRPTVYAGMSHHNVLGHGGSLNRIASLGSVGALNRTSHLIPATFVSESVLVVPVSLGAGRYGLRVSINGQRVEGSEVVFTSYDPPRVDDLSTTTGFVQGGGWVDAIGGDFVDTGVSFVRFQNPDGSVLADVAATIMSGSRMGCAAPPCDSPREVTVSVSLNGRDYYGAHKCVTCCLLVVVPLTGLLPAPGSLRPNLFVVSPTSPGLRTSHSQSRRWYPLRTASLMAARR